jgi:restriction system protein
VLIDGEQVAQRMIDNNLGYTSKKVYELKNMDVAYFGVE